MHHHRHSSAAVQVAACVAQHSALAEGRRDGDRATHCHATRSAGMETVTTRDRTPDRRPADC